MERDPALERRFQPIKVEEPSVEETIDILRGLKSRYEDHHDLNITDDAIQEAANLASRYITDRFLPDKGIDVIDEAASRVRIRNSTMPVHLKDAMKALESVKKDKETAIQSQKYEAAAQLREQELSLADELEGMETEWKSERTQDRPNVTADDVAEVVSMWTGVPVTRLATEEIERLLKMEEALHEKIIGQDEAINVVAKAVRRARAGLKDRRRPIGNFIFLGPTGVGKTYLVRALAEFMFGSEESLIRIDMSEFMERHAVSRLVGAPPGYIGYDEGGQLTEAVRRRSYSAILLDEIEKAHPDVFNLLLQIFDDGHLTDAKGRKVDFRNSLVVMTSNIGAELIRRDNSLGFSISMDENEASRESYERMKEKVLSEVKRFFRPEFLNRIDGIVVFHALTRDHILQIVDLLLDEVRINLTEKGVSLEISDAAKELLAVRGYDPTFGARPLKRVIQDLIEDPLSEQLLQGRFGPGDMVFIDVDGGEITVGPVAELAKT